jgi:hypothetical protein
MPDGFQPFGDSVVRQFGARRLAAIPRHERTAIPVAPIAMQATMTRGCAIAS